MLKIFRKVLGYKFLVNKSTGEVHRLSKVTGACHIKNMAKHNKMYVTKNKVQKMINNGLFNGCVHCFKDKDTD